MNAFKIQLQDKVSALEMNLQKKDEEDKKMHQKFEDLLYLVEANGIRLFNLMQEVKQKKDKDGIK